METVLIMNSNVTSKIEIGDRIDGQHNRSSTTQCIVEQNRLINIVYRG